MNNTQIRQKIHDYVNRADERFLTLVNGMIEADKDSGLVERFTSCFASLFRSCAGSVGKRGRPATPGSNGGNKSKVSAVNYSAKWLPEAESTYALILDYLQDNWTSKEIMAFIDRTDEVIR